MGASSRPMSRGLVSLGLVDPDPAEPPRTNGTAGPISPPLTSRPARGTGGIAVSTILHILIIALVVDIAIVRAPPAPQPAPASKPSANAVFLPPPAQVRRMLGLPPAPGPCRRRPRPRPRTASASAPPRPCARARRWSCTATTTSPSSPRARRRRRSAPQPAAPPTPPPPADFVRDAGRAPRRRRAAGADARPARRGLRHRDPSVPRCERLETSGVSPGPLGVASGTGGQMGPLFFDPQGADFTLVDPALHERGLPELDPAAVGGAGARGAGRLRVRGRPQRRHRGPAAAGVVGNRGLRPGRRATRWWRAGCSRCRRTSPPPRCTMRVGFVYNLRQGGRGGR